MNEGIEFVESKLESERQEVLHLQVNFYVDDGMGHCHYHCLTLCRISPHNYKSNLQATK